MTSDNRDFCSAPSKEDDIFDHPSLPAQNVDALFRLSPSRTDAVFHQRTVHMSDNCELGDESMPADLKPAIEALSKTFDEAHWEFGELTRVLCFARLHNVSQTLNDEEIKKFIPPLWHAQGQVGPAAALRFNELWKKHTLPATFKAFVDLYIDGVTMRMLLIFKELVAIAEANRPQLKGPHIQWARLQMMKVIHADTYKIKRWVRDVCDVQVYNPADDDPDEIVYWKNWQAPSLIAMEPSLRRPFEGGKEWERNDAETSSRWLKHFSDYYVLHLESELDGAADRAVVEWAQTLTHQPVMSSAPERDVPAVTADVRDPKLSIRREANKLATQERNKELRKRHKALSKAHPDKPDSWIALKIAPLFPRISKETIRKLMKTKQ